MKSGGLVGYVYITLVILLTVYGQLILKWRINQLNMAPTGVRGGFKFIYTMLTDLYIISGLLAAFLASFAWMAAMTKFELSFAYPFMSLNFLLVLFFGVFLFGETITLGKLLGIIFIVIGLIVSVKY